MKLYHGTSFGFEQFNGSPMFFTCNFQAAANYAVASGMRYRADVEPRVIEIEIDVSNFRSFRLEEFRALHGDERCAEIAGDVWEAFYQHSWEYQSDYDGAVVYGAHDFAGVHEGIRHVAAYDQYLVFNTGRLELIASHEVEDRYIRVS